MDIKEYIKTRLNEQESWYERKASSNKKQFLNYQKVIIILGSVIPLVVLIGSVVEEFQPFSGVISAFISAAIAIIAGFDKLFQPQTNWYNYRANEEVMKKEKWLYEFEVGPYTGLNKADAEKLLVERIEGVISADMVRFSKAQEKKEQEQKEEEPEDQNDKQVVAG